MNERNVTDEYLRRRATEREVEHETRGGMWVIMYGFACLIALGVAVLTYVVLA